MNIAELFVRVTADVAGLERGMTRAQRSMQQAGDTMQGLGRTMSLALTVPLAAFGTAAVANATKLDSLTRALRAVAAPGEDVAVQLERLREVAKLPGLGFEEAIQGSVNLQAVGFSAAEAERTLKAFGNAIASTGGGKAELDRVITQLTQMASAGKILTADLRPMIQTSPLIAKALQQIFGTIDAQTISEQLEASGKSFDDFLAALTVALEGLPEVSSGPKVAFENLADSFTVASAAIGDRLLPAVTAIAGALAAMLEGMGSLSPVTQNLIIGFAAAAAALGPLLLAVGTFVKLLPLLQAGMAVLVGTGGPIFLAAAAFGALVAAGLALVQNWGVIRFEVGRLIDEIKRQFEERFGPLVTWIGEKVQAVTGFFSDMFEAVVGHSFVPDMVEAIEREFGRMGGTFDDATRAIADFTLGSGQAITAFVEQAVRDLTRLLVKMAIVRALQAAFAGSTGGFGAFVLDAIGGGGPAAAPALGGAVNIIDALGPIPRPLSPNEAATHVWYRSAFQLLAADHAERG